MKRLHIHVGVENLDDSIRFYNALFGAEPVKTKPDYAKWLIDDPRVNFAISTRVENGVDHLGIQVEEDGELAELRSRMEGADMTRFDEGETVCCYARSDKTWVTDPAGLAWEAYQTMEDAQVYGVDRVPGESEAACCVPSAVSDALGEPSEQKAECCG